MGQSMRTRKIITLERMRQEHEGMAKFCDLMLMYFNNKASIADLTAARNSLYAQGITFDEFHILLLRLHLSSTLRHTLLM